MPRGLFAGSMVALLGLDALHLLNSVCHDVPFCPPGEGRFVLGAWYCSSFLAVSMYFGLVQVCALALGLALMTMVRARVRWGAVIGAVLVLSTGAVMWEFSREALDLAGVETAETLVAGSMREVVGMNALLAILLLAVWAAGLHELQLRRRGATGLASGA